MKVSDLIYEEIPSYQDFTKKTAVYPENTSGSLSAIMYEGIPFNEQEEIIRNKFERFAKKGTRPHLYTLQRVANGEYVSMYSEEAYQNFKEGFRCVNTDWAKHEGVDYFYYND